MIHRGQGKFPDPVFLGDQAGQFPGAAVSRLADLDPVIVEPEADSAGGGVILPAHSHLVAGRINGDVEAGDGAVHAIVNGVFQGVGAGVTGGRRVGDPLVGDHGAAVLGRGGDRQGQGVAIRVRIIGQHVHVNRLIDIGLRAVISRHRRRVDHIDGDGDGGGIGIQAAVVGLEGKTVGAVIPRGRGVGIGTVRGQIEAPVGRGAHHGIGQGVAIRVGGGDRAVQGRVLIHAHRLV